MNTKKMVLTSILMTLAIIIPVVFGSFLSIKIPPFSATLGAHVPLFLSMFLGPLSAVMVAIGSAIGFLITSPIFIAARALMHTAVAFVGSKMIKNGHSFLKSMVVTAPIHATLECLIVIPFGFAFKEALIVIGLGTLLHHSMDAVVTKCLLPVMMKASSTFKENTIEVNS